MSNIKYLLKDKRRLVSKSKKCLENAVRGVDDNRVLFRFKLFHVFDQEFCHLFIIESGVNKFGVHNLMKTVNRAAGLVFIKMGYL